MQTVLALGTLIAAAAVTYLFCIRPMLQGRCTMDAADRSRPSPDEDAARTEIAGLRAQLDALRETSTVDPERVGGPVHAEQQTRH